MEPADTIERDRRDDAENKENARKQVEWVQLCGKEIAFTTALSDDGQTQEEEGQQAS